MRIQDAPGIVIQADSPNYLKVKWLDDGVEVGMYFRKELKLLSRAKRTEKTPKKSCK